MMKLWKVVGAICACCVFSQASLATVIHNESIDGDLSDNSLAPTALGSLAVGTNTVTGSLLNGDNIDTFSFVVSGGRTLEHLYFTFDNTGFIFGSNVFLLLPGDAIESLNTANTSFVSGSDLLQFYNLGTLGPANYAFDMRGFGDSFGLASYRFDMVITDPAAVPEPSTYALMLAGLGLLGFMARRRKQ